MKFAKILAVLFALVVVGAAGLAAAVYSYSKSLPQMIKVDDWKPLLVTEVYARGGEKIGEFYRENRTVVPYEKIPKRLVEAFLAAEDDTFFQHGGINYLAMARAGVINIISGEKTQGASTITQQVARAIILQNKEKTYARKIKEVLLSYRMEENLTKEEIMYLYLNQIYFGDGANGIAAAADTYFRKPVDQLTLPEMAILAGLPKAPSAYSPSHNPKRAKQRQIYVLERMAKVGYISAQESKSAINTLVTVYTGKEYKDVAPYFVETIRQLLVQQLGEQTVLDEGLKIYASVDYKAQQAAQAQVQEGLRDLDKREGYRGAPSHMPEGSGNAELEKFLLATRKKLKADSANSLIIKPDGNLQPDIPLTVFHKKDAAGKTITNIPEYVNKNQIVDAVVTKVDDKLGLTYVRFAEGLGIIDVGDMGWARKPDPGIGYDYAARVTKPSTVLKAGDIISVRVTGEKFVSLRLADLAKPKKKGVVAESVPNFEDYAQVKLEQTPQVEGALLSFDQKSGEVIAMVGGYEWIHNKNEFNRTLQAKRQTGSSFKTIVYASALDKGYTPATPIQDAPIVFDLKTEEGQEDAEEVKKWKPHNHGGQKFVGDILFRTALVRSLNIPAVKILESVGVNWAMDYARRLGVFSSLNPDFSLALGSSSLTLYEMTKVFSEFGRLGQRVHPIVIHKVVDKEGKTLLENVTLDQRFAKETTEIDKQYEDRRKVALEQAAKDAGSAVDASVPENKKAMKPNIFFPDENQLLSPQTAYVMTTLLSGVINEEGGTAARARSLGRPAAGKTGSTNGYYDGWFLGYTPQVVTGVWVGFDGERTLGPGEVGGRTALPIWLEYMKAVHKDLPIQDFQVPTGIVFANIDGQTGKLASASSGKIVRQAFVQGTEPKEITGVPTRDDETDFLKKDFTE